MAEKEKIQEVLPEGWETLYIRNKAILEYGEGLPEEKRKEGDVPVYGSNGIVGYHDNYLIKGPGIIIGRKGTVGAVNFTTENYWPIDTAYYIRFIGEEDNIKWFYYYLTTLNLTSLNSATGVPGLNRGDVYDLKIKCPPLPEQRTIASILSTCDEAIEKTDVKIEKLKHIKQGLMQDLFRYGIDENGKMRSEATHRFKDSPLGRIPEEWEVKIFNDIATIKRGASPRPIDDPKYFSEMGRGWIRISDVTSVYKYLDHTEQYLSLLGENNSVKINPGDLIMSICATIGKPAILKMYACIHDGFVHFSKLKQEIDTEWLFYLIDFSQYKIASLNQTGTQGNLNAGIVGLYAFAQPPKPEQSRIASILSSADEAIEKEEAYKQKLLAIKRGLMEDLLSGKVRVNKLIREAA